MKKCVCHSRRLKHECFCDVSGLTVVSITERGKFDYHRFTTNRSEHVRNLRAAKNDPTRFTLSKKLGLPIFGRRLTYREFVQFFREEW